VSPFKETQRLLKEHQTTVHDLINEALDRIAAADRCNAIVYTQPKASLEDARAVDHELRQGAIMPLAGMTVVLKDNIAQEGWPLTCASKILGDFVSPYDATAVQRLKNAGAVIIGRANMDEFAMGSSTEHSRFGPARNPHDPTLVTGGSSGGSAAAVALGLCQVALGSDTGGSVRQPAAFCGVYGLKPTYGRISRFGLVAFASSLDQIGILARHADDLALVLHIVAGHDPRDETSEDAPAPPQETHPDIQGLRIGIPREYLGEGLAGEIAEVIERLRGHLTRGGAIIQDISLPHTRYAIPVYYILADAEASSNLARYDGVRYGARAENVNSLEELYVRSRSQGFGEEVKRRIMLGTYALSSGYYEAYYARAQRVRRLIRDDFIKTYADVDLIMTPVAPTAPFKIGEKLTDPLTMYLSDIYTVQANLAGIPGLSIPLGRGLNNLPLAVQILGPHFGEGLLLRIARHLEENPL
jgi:aspartyl-tRNA(Asn)/glutamyl-tRNA(Gln) amidotransferase subunit A